MPHCITILSPGFEETEAVTVIDLLRRAQIRVSVLGLHSLAVKGSHDITIRTDGLLQDFDEPFDGIVLPGGMPGTTNLAESNTVLDLVRDAHCRQALCAAICAAPLVLGRAGILQNRTATCYPGIEKELFGATVVKETVVRDKNIITSRGPGTAVAFGLAIVSYLAGQTEADRIAAAVLHSR
ncbi:MAG: DJ-1/PfpI family protein [Chitinispirillaceae bacterium]|nr:DJ-1/PfpI family protein [Chitinispirillaceae bacterium]